MSKTLALTQVRTVILNKFNAIMGILVLLCLGTILWAYTPIPWYLAVALIALIVTFGIMGEIILFVLSYKVYERWFQRRYAERIPPFNRFISIIVNGYMRSLWFFCIVVLLLSFFHASVFEIIRAFSWIFMGANIFITFLSASPSTWDKHSSIPAVLGIGFGIQVLFLLILKIIS